MHEQGHGDGDGNIAVSAVVRREGEHGESRARYFARGAGAGATTWKKTSSLRIMPSSLRARSSMASSALLQVAHLGVERVVARPEARVHGLLRGHLLVEARAPQPAALADPEWILERQNEAGEDGGECLHFSW